MFSYQHAIKIGLLQLEQGEAHEGEKKENSYAVKPLVVLAKSLYRIIS
jgi:hypothetical protein